MGFGIREFSQEREIGLRKCLCCSYNIRTVPKLLHNTTDLTRPSSHLGMGTSGLVHTNRVFPLNLPALSLLYLLEH